MGGLFPAVAQAQAADPRLDKVFSDWQKRFDRTGTVSYQVKGEWVVPRGAWEANEYGQPPVVERPPRDIVLVQKRKLLLDLPKQRYRYEGEEQCPNSQKGTIYTEAYIHMFNGKELYAMRPPGFTHDPENPFPALNEDVGITSGDFKQRSFESIHWPLFIGHGIVCAVGGPVSGQLAPQRDKELFYVHGEGTLEGSPCLILRTFPRHASESNFKEFYVDLTKDSAVLRQTSYARDRPVSDTTIQYQSTSGGWLPKKWVASFFLPSGRTFKTERMKVEEIVIDSAVSDSDFQVEIKPGMSVRKVQLASPASPERAPQVNTTTYRVNSLGLWDQTETVNGVERTRWPVSPWWLTLLVLPLAGFIWWRVYRRLRLRPKQLPTTLGTGT